MTIQQKSPAQTYGIFGGRIEHLRPLPRIGEVTFSATQGMLGETLLCLKMADFLNIFAALGQGQ